MHQTLLVEELQKQGAEVEFLDRPMSRDPHDQLLSQIRGAVAEYERTLIAERMRSGPLVQAARPKPACSEKQGRHRRCGAEQDDPNGKTVSVQIA